MTNLNDLINSPKCDEGYILVWNGVKNIVYSEFRFFLETSSDRKKFLPSYSYYYAIHYSEFDKCFSWQFSP